MSRLPFDCLQLYAFTLHAVESETLIRKHILLDVTEICLECIQKENTKALEHNSGSSHSSALTFRQLGLYSLILWRLKNVFTNKMQKNHMTHPSVATNTTITRICYNDQTPNNNQTQQLLHICHLLDTQQLLQCVTDLSDNC